MAEGLGIEEQVALGVSNTEQEDSNTQSPDDGALVAEDVRRRPRPKSGFRYAREMTKVRVRASSPASVLRRRHAVWAKASLLHGDWHVTSDGATRMVGLYRKFAIANCRDAYRAAFRRDLISFLMFLFDALLVLVGVVIAWMTWGPAFVLVVVVALVLLFWLVFWVLSRFPLMGVRTGLVVSISPVVVLASSSGFSFAARQPPLVNAPISELMIGTAISYAVLFCIFTLGGALFQGDVRVRGTGAGVTASGELVNVLSQLSLENPLLFFDTRNEIIRSLGRAADSIGRELPKAIKIPDQEQARAFAGRCEAAALHLRGLRLWIALPKTDTVDRLVVELVSVIDALVKGTYDDLPNPSGPNRRSGGFVGRLSTQVKSILSGFLPIGAILGARALGLELDGVAGDALSSFGILWASVTLLMVLDPKVSERLGAIREFLLIVRSGGGGGGKRI